MIRFSCPQCKLVLQATEQKVGSITACPKCSKRMKVPDGPTKARMDDGRSTQSSFSMEQAVAGEWHYVKNNKKVGPLTLDDLKQLLAAGQLQASDLIIKNGMQKWLPLHGVLDLLPQSPAVTAPKEWYFVRDKKKQGPVSLADLKQLASAGQLSASDMVLKEGTQKWLTAGTLPDVCPVVKPEPSPAVVEKSKPAIPLPASPAPSAVAPSSPAIVRPVAPSVEPPRSAVLARPVPVPDDDDYIDEPPLPSSSEGSPTPRDEPTVVAPVRPSKKKRKAKPARRPKSNVLLRGLIAAWLGVVVFRTVALLQFKPELSLWIWPIEWVAGLAIAWLSYRRKIRLGVLVGLLGPLLVLGAMGSFTALGLPKEEALEYLRWVMLPYGVIALLLGILVLQGSRRPPRKGKAVKSIRTRNKKRPSPSTMRLEGSRRAEKDSSESELAAME